MIIPLRKHRNIWYTHTKTIQDHAVPAPKMSCKPCLCRNFIGQLMSRARVCCFMRYDLWHLWLVSLLRPWSQRNLKFAWKPCVVRQPWNGWSLAGHGPHWATWVATTRYNFQLTNISHFFLIDISMVIDTSGRFFDGILFWWILKGPGGKFAPHL